MTLLRLLLVVLRVALLGAFVGGLLYAITEAAGLGGDAITHAFGVPK